MLITFSTALSLSETDEAVRWGLLVGAGAALSPFVALILMRRWTGRSIVVGRDNRISAGKTVSVMWTFLVTVGLIAILFADLLGHPEPFRRIGNSTALGQYAVLFGSALAAAVLADGLLGSDAVEAPSSEVKMLRIVELVVDDRGKADFGRIQYLVVSLTAAAYFVTLLLHEPAQGLPHLPGVVVALVAISAAGYVANTAFQRSSSRLSGWLSMLRPTSAKPQDEKEPGAVPQFAGEIGPEPRRWFVTAAGLLAVGLVLGSLAFLLWGTGARLRTSEVARVDGGRGSGRDAATWFGVVLLLLLLAQAALTFFKSGAVDEAVKRAARRVKARFGLELGVVWPHLDTVLPGDAREDISNTRTRAEATAAMAAGYWIALPLGIVLLAVARGWPFILGVLVLVAPALAIAATSRADLAAARYGAALDALVARHRFDLVRAMRLDLPDTPSDELVLNRELSSFLGGEKPLGETPFAVEYRPDPDQELSHLGGEVKELRKVLADPAMVNWSGFVSLQVQEGAGDIHEGRPLPAGARLRALVTFSEMRGQAVAQEEIDIRDGQDVATAVFAVALDSGTIRFPPGPLEVAVQRGGGAVQAVVDFTAPAEPGEHPLWLEVRQSNRLIQVVRTVLELAPRGP